MPLIEHEYPIYQDGANKESGRSLQFCVGTENCNTVDEAIRAQARLEGKSRPVPVEGKKKRKR